MATAQGALLSSLLVRTSAGYVEATAASAYGRIEGFLSLGNNQNQSEALDVANGLLATRSVPSLAITAGLEPAGAGDTPYAAFNVGDTVTAPGPDGTPTSYRVVGFTVTEDTEGNPIWVPELNTLSQESDQQYQRSLKRMTNGTLQGSSNLAAPASSVSATPPTPPNGPSVPELANVPMAGPLAVGLSPREKATVNCRVVKLIITLDTPGTTQTVGWFLINGSNGGRSVSFTIPANTAEVDLTVSVDLVGGTDYYQGQVVTAGNGAANLNIQPATA